MGEDKKKKILCGNTFSTLREIVSFINENSIEKDDLVHLGKDAYYYVLLYYK